MVKRSIKKKFQMSQTYTKSICVYCGSRFGKDPAFKQAAADLGTGIAQNNWRLVYGAGDVGLMGEVANATQAAGGQTFGVIPEHLFNREVGKHDLTSFIITENMHERKKVMYMNSDVIIVLPGGAGSLDEFFEILTWRQLGLHTKPIYLLNINGYWDALIGLLNHTIAQGFANENLAQFYAVVETVPRLVESIKSSGV